MERLVLAALLVLLTLLALAVPSFRLRSRGLPYRLRFGAGVLAALFAGQLSLFFLERYHFSVGLMITAAILLAMTPLANSIMGWLVNRNRLELADVDYSESAQLERGAGCRTGLLAGCGAATLLALASALASVVAHS